MSVESQIVRCYSDSAIAAIDELKNDIKSLCRDKWEPTGGITVCKDEDNDFVACQAMIKKTDKK